MELMLAVVLSSIMMFFWIRLAYLAAKLRKLKEKGDSNFHWFHDFYESFLFNGGISNNLVSFPFVEKYENLELEKIRKERNATVIYFWIALLLFFTVPLCLKYFSIIE